jgi:hypothetical protein
VASRSCAGAPELDDKEPDLGSMDSLKLRRETLRTVALTGFPLYRTSNPVLDRPASSSGLPPPPNLPFNSQAQPVSPTRRALMKDLLEQSRRTLHYNPYTIVDLRRERTLGQGRCRLRAV